MTVTTTPPPVGISISPTSASVQTGATQQFTATVTGTSNRSVTWSASSGSISSSGLYTAPATAGSYTVKATSAVDSTKSASATVSVTNTSIVVTVSPSLVAIQTGATQQFTAAVTGTGNTAVTWSTTRGTITTGGLYTAPNAAGTYSVIATSVADRTKSAAVAVNVSAPPTPISVAITPTSASIQAGATQQFTATVTGSTNTAVTWSASGGSVSGSGLYTAPGTPGTYTVKATSAADGTKSASAGVTVTSTPAQIAVSPTSLSFASIAANTSSTQTLKISNTGGSNLSVTGATVTGNGFSVSGTSFPITVSAGQSVNLTVKFAPTAAGNLLRHDHGVEQCGQYCVCGYFIGSGDSSSFAFSDPQLDGKYVNRCRILCVSRDTIGRTVHETTIHVRAWNKLYGYDSAEWKQLLLRCDCGRAVAGWRVPYSNEATAVVP